MAAGVGGAGPQLDANRLLPAPVPLHTQLAQAQALSQAQAQGLHEGGGGQTSLPMWADRFAMQWQRGEGGGGGVAPWMQERVAQASTVSSRALVSCPCSRNMASQIDEWCHITIRHLVAAASARGCHRTILRACVTALLLVHHDSSMYARW